MLLFSILIICLKKVLSFYCNIWLPAIGNVLKLYKRVNYTDASLISLNHVQKRFCTFHFNRMTDHWIQFYLRLEFLLNEIKSGTELKNSFLVMNISSKSYFDIHENVLKNKTHLISTKIFFQHKHKYSVKY